MSAVINTTGITPGCIYRITVEDFVTYRRIELFPGPSLNLITGANGTGKSTIVSAITLGLNEKANVIDVEKKLPDYIRRGCESATIEIELYRQRGQNNVIITRTFNKSSFSQWYINRESVSWRRVQELVASLNIQVENLCQFLPQHRVHEFSRLDSQKLFRNTLMAIKGQDSVNQLDDLINCRNNQKDNIDKIQTNEQRVQGCQRDNERLKIKIDAMVDRRNIENEIDICKKKKLWLEYQKFYDKASDCLRRKKMAEKAVEVLKKKLEPSERDINNVKIAITRLEQEKSDATKKYYEWKREIGDKFVQVRRQEQKLYEIENSYENIIKMNDNSTRDLQEARAKLEKLNIDKTTLVQQQQDGTHREKLTKLDDLISRTSLGMKKSEEKKLNLELYLSNELTPQISSCRDRINDLKNENAKRLNTLRNYSEDTYKAVLWFRENRNMFKHNVYEPIMLTIKFTDPKFAQYLENTVRARDFVVFTFEDIEDMNKFLKIVREEKGWRRVNAVHSEGGMMDSREFPSAQLRYLGFYTYLVNEVIAPEAIINYLCKYYQIHQIPLGNDHTYRNNAKVNGIRCFFTENHKFSVRISKYSREKSSTIIEIRSPRLLANTVDDGEIAALQQQLSNYESEFEIKKKELNNTNAQLSKLNYHWNRFKAERKIIAEELNKMEVISTRITLQEKKVRKLETEEPTFDIEKEKADWKLKRNECVTKQCKLQLDLSNIIVKIHEKLVLENIVRYKLEFTRRSIAEKDSALCELRGQLKNEANDLRNLNTTYNESMDMAKEKLKEAKRSTDNKMYGENDFPYKRQFAELPNDLRSLQDHYHELESRKDSMDPGDEQDMRVYEENERKIETWKLESQAAECENTELESRMAIIRLQWLPSIEYMLTDINRSFSDMFRRLGCVGEIKFENGGTDHYDKYGISIMVSFRESDEMQQLTRYVQSGGERTVTTAIYLMALQRITTIPFRCIDEINQGMDAVNERKMLELMFEVASEHDNAQCFLLSPSLIRKLPYNGNVMVHTIMNGQRLMNNKKWQFDSFLQNARRYRN